MTTKTPPKKQAETQPAKPRSNKNWKVTDLAGMDEQQREEHMAQVLSGAVNKPSKVNSVGKGKDKMPKKPEKQPETVKSDEKQAAKPRGQVSTYNEDVAANICDLIAEGVPLRQICRHPDMPAWRTVYAWRAAHPEFDARFAHARVAGFDAIAEETLDIADDTTNDTLIGENGPRANTEWIARSKLRIETRLKLLAKWDPKRYGERVDLNHGGQADNPIVALMHKVAGSALPIASGQPDDSDDE
jgi:hypothetical protein